MIGPDFTTLAVDSHSVKSRTLGPVTPVIDVIELVDIHGASLTSPQELIAVSPISTSPGSLVVSGLKGLGRGLKDD